MKLRWMCCSLLAVTQVMMAQSNTPRKNLLASEERTSGAEAQTPFQGFSGTSGTRALSELARTGVFPHPDKTGAGVSAVVVSTLEGFSSKSSSDENNWEKKFRDAIVPDNIRENMRRLSARPHHVGSAYDKDNAEWILSKFKEWGFDARIETFTVLFPTPKERVVELVEPTKFSAKLQEPVLPMIPRRTRPPNSSPPTMPIRLMET